MRYSSNASVTRTQVGNSSGRWRYRKAIEHIAIEGDPRAIDPVLATNAYVLSDNGWHLWLHHAGALPAVVAADDPETQTPTLH